MFLSEPPIYSTKVSLLARMNENNIFLIFSLIPISFLIWYQTKFWVPYCPIFFSLMMARRGSTTGSSNRFGTLDSTHSDQSQMDNYRSPYFLDNGNHPAVGLVSHHPTGSNYNTWSRAMSMALNAKNKLRSSLWHMVSL